MGAMGRLARRLRAGASARAAHVRLALSRRCGAAAARGAGRGRRATPRGAHDHIRLSSRPGKARGSAARCRPARREPHAVLDDQRPGGGALGRVRSRAHRCSRGSSRVGRAASGARHCSLSRVRRRSLRARALVSRAWTAGGGAGGAGSAHAVRRAVARGARSDPGRRQCAPGRPVRTPATRHQARRRRRPRWRDCRSRGGAQDRPVPGAGARQPHFAVRPAAKLGKSGRALPCRRGPGRQCGGRALRLRRAARPPGTVGRGGRSLSPRTRAQPAPRAGPQQSRPDPRAVPSVRGGQRGVSTRRREPAHAAHCAFQPGTHAHRVQAPRRSRDGAAEAHGAARRRGAALPVRAVDCLRAIRAQGRRGQVGDRGAGPRAEVRRPDPRRCDRQKSGNDQMRKSLLLVLSALRRKIFPHHVASAFRRKIFRHHVASACRRKILPHHVASAFRRKVTLLALVLVSLVLPAKAGSHKSAEFPATQPLFIESAEPTGLTFTHVNGATGQYYMAEQMGAGVALFDYDNDGDLDVFLVQDGPLEQAHAPRTSGPSCRLFRNDLVVGPDGKRTVHFTDVTERAGLALRTYGMGAAVGDYDGDGNLDLFVTAFGPDTLFHNSGNGTFTDVTAQAGVSDPLWSTSAAFVDYDRDGDLDLFVANYLDFNLAVNKVCHDAVGTRDYCSPRAYRPVPDKLYRNDGNGHFTDVTDSSGISKADGAGL